MSKNYKKSKKLYSDNVSYNVLSELRRYVTYISKLIPINRFCENVKPMRPIHRKSVKNLRKCDTTPTWYDSLYYVTVAAGNY